MIGYLPQEFHPVGNLSGREYLRLCADLRGVPLRRADLDRRLAALLDAVELGGAADRRADRYSGGMVRRLGLAQALVHGPKFLVVDEPTAGLDPEERLRFRNLITDLAEEIPVLLSTHIVEDIEATCPRLVILARGRILFDGAPGVLLDRIGGELWSLSAPQEPPAGSTVLGQRAAAGGGARKILWSKRPVAGAEPVEPTLEEACSAFLRLEARQALDDEGDKGTQP